MIYKKICILICETLLKGGYISIDVMLTLSRIQILDIVIANVAIG